VVGCHYAIEYRQIKRILASNNPIRFSFGSLPVKSLLPLL
jgi:hypothetical protein